MTSNTPNDRHNNRQGCRIWPQHVQIEVPIIARSGHNNTSTDTKEELQILNKDSELQTVSVQSRHLSSKILGQTVAHVSLSKRWDRNAATTKGKGQHIDHVSFQGPYFFNCKYCQGFAQQCIFIKTREIFTGVTDYRENSKPIRFVTNQKQIVLEDPSFYTYVEELHSQKATSKTGTQAGYFGR